MRLFNPEIDIEHGVRLAARVHPKYGPVFDCLTDRDRAALAFYFLPHRSKKDVLEVTRPRVIKWYCPFADQRTFPSGHRYCINVYTGCEHECRYCYATGYAARQPDCKKTFRADLLKDLDALDAYAVPPAPVHLSNSTDPLQSLEAEYGDTLFALERIAQHRHRFTTLTLLTKNPAALTDPRYLRVLQSLSKLSADHPCRATFEEAGHLPLRVECSLAFHDDASRRLMDPAAPSVDSRMEAIRTLRQNGIPVFVRIDPLFPHDPLAGGPCMADFDLPDIQPMADLERLVRFAREVGAARLVYSVAKITRPRFGELPPVMQKLKQLYQHLASGPLVCRGGSWRLPPDVAESLVVEPFLRLCCDHGVEAKVCKANLISTP